MSCFAFPTSAGDYALLDRAFGQARRMPPWKQFLVLSFFALGVFAGRPRPSVGVTRRLRLREKSNNRSGCVSIGVKNHIHSASAAATS